MAGKTETYKCDWCKGTFEARVADRNRGWARFCSKACKACRQEKRTGQYARYIHAGDSSDMHEAAMDGVEVGWDAHKDMLF